MKKLIEYFFLLIIGIAIFSCDSGKNKEAEAFLESLDSVSIETPAISEEVISSLMEQIPSPLEISVLLKESGAGYDKSILNSYDNSSNYHTSSLKAINLGIYGADLGYTNVFEENLEGLKYLRTVKGLADDLRIGQFFDLETIGRLATSSNNLDSLLMLTTKNFNSINQYLQTQRRANLSVLLLAGGWLEALHITCQVASKNPENAELNEKIGEQKITLESIMLLLSFFSETNEDIKLLMKDMTNLKNVFDKVEIIYTYEESTVEIVDGVMVIKDNSSSTINITNSIVEEITNSTKEIRSKFI
jgi:hypothetical protein